MVFGETDMGIPQNVFPDVSRCLGKDYMSGDI